VQGGRVGDGVAVDGQDVGVEAGRDASLRCPSPITPAATEVIMRSASACPIPTSRSIAGACRTTSCGLIGAMPASLPATIRAPAS
jgi:hypothetical protein